MIETTRYLNQYLGTHLAPWELEGVPALWIEIVFAGADVRASLAEAGLLKG